MNGIFLAKRSGWIVRMGSGDGDAVSQYWNMLACCLGWKVKSCFVILGSLKNCFGIICLSCNVRLPNINVFGNLGRKSIT